MKLILLCGVLGYTLFVWKYDNLRDDDGITRILVTAIYGAVYSAGIWAVLSGGLWLLTRQPFRLTITILKNGHLLFTLFS